MSVNKYLFRTHIIGSYLPSICLAILLLCILSPVKAQYGTGNLEKIKKLEGRTLIVVEEEVSARIVKILKTKRNPDQLDRYQKKIAAYNAALHEAVEKFWKFNTPVVYKTFSEAEKLFKSKDYAVLFCATYENNKRVGESGAKMLQGIAWSYQDVNVKRDYWDKYTVMQIRLIEELNKPEPVFSQNLSNVFPEKSDIVFGLQALQQYACSEKNSKDLSFKKAMQVSSDDLSSKTLLLKQEWIHTSLSETEVKSIYPYNVQISDGATFNNLVMQADSGYAYVQIIPQIASTKNRIKIQYLHVIMDATDGKILGLSSPGMSDGTKIITKANLKDYLHSVKHKDAKAANQ
ncbi:hypothetical protein GXP67_25220 [Rhodocytophaga rosea]|uniref:Uncharacterized protein n=1 Tax=Rhodocytophaga rosea TaxID=2704465 RepID=A0A6C0GNT3_9BACT|nr:hypothetical protein [Rhodocytophaga rosea]QHT69711.1 hypothetical protein GXP67_25220 [Rhodocytophaga rosea]